VVSPLHTDFGAEFCALTDAKFVQPSATALADDLKQ
jgi:hypothetical protein